MSRHPDVATSIRRSLQREAPPAALFDFEWVRDLPAPSSLPPALITLLAFEVSLGATPPSPCLYAPGCGCLRLLPAENAPASTCAPPSPSMHASWPASCSEVPSLPSPPRLRRSRWFSPRGAVPNPGPRRLPAARQIACSQHAKCYHPAGPPVIKRDASKRVSATLGARPESGPPAAGSRITARTPREPAARARAQSLGGGALPGAR
jgi:hypothetical protein